MNLDNFDRISLNDNQRKAIYDPQSNTTIVFNNSPNTPENNFRNSYNSESSPISSEEAPP